MLRWDRVSGGAGGTQGRAFYITQGDFNDAAIPLHQAAVRLHNGVLLVMML